MFSSKKIMFSNTNNTGRDYPPPNGNKTTSFVVEFPKFYPKNIVFQEEINTTEFFDILGGDQYQSYDDYFPCPSRYGDELGVCLNRTYSKFKLYHNSVLEFRTPYLPGDNFPTTVVNNITTHANIFSFIYNDEKTFSLYEDIYLEDFGILKGNCDPIYNPCLPPDEDEDYGIIARSKTIDQVRYLNLPVTIAHARPIINNNNGNRITKIGNLESVPRPAVSIFEHQWPYCFLVNDDEVYFYTKEYDYWNNIEPGLGLEVLATYLNNELATVNETGEPRLPLISILNKTYNYDIVSNDYFIIELWQSNFQDNMKIVSIKDWGYLYDIPWPIHLDPDQRGDYVQTDRLKFSELSSVPSYIPPYFKTLRRLFKDNKVFNDESICFWDVGNCTNFREMFDNSSFNHSLNSWNVSNGESFVNMFANCSYNFPLNNWNMRSAKSLASMFENNDAFNQDISSWNIMNVTNLSRMFKNSIFNQDVSSWDVSNCTNFSEMFADNSVFNQNLNSWDVRAAEYITSMFLNATSFNQDFLEWVFGQLKLIDATDFCTNTAVDENNFINTIIAWSNMLNYSSNVRIDFGPVPVVNPIVGVDLLEAGVRLRDKGYHIYRNGDRLVGE